MACFNFKEKIWSLKLQFNSRDIKFSKIIIIIITVNERFIYIT